MLSLQWSLHYSHHWMKWLQSSICAQFFFYREKEIPPSLFPTRSPWCHSPNVPAHPYCALTNAHNTSVAEHCLNRQPRSTRRDPVQVGQRDIFQWRVSDVCVCAELVKMWLSSKSLLSVKNYSYLQE